MSPDGTHAFVSSYVSTPSPSSSASRAGFSMVGEVQVGRRPTGMSVSPDGEHLYVAHYLRAAHSLESRMDERHRYDVADVRERGHLR